MDAKFNQPGSHTFGLGLELTVFDICDSSVFPSAPTLSKTSVEYYIGDGDVDVTVQYASDTISV